jgi:hypothetical protein
MFADAPYIPTTKEGFRMAAHFQEYLAAIAAMHDIYGDAGDEHPSEFHEAAETAATAAPSRGDGLAVASS